MKLWILMVPSLLVGTAFADGYATYPQGQTQESPTITKSLQDMNKTIDAPLSAPSVKADKAEYPFGHFSEPMSYLAFAAIIKYQFPGHDGLDSLALATSAVQAYPVYVPFVKFPPAK